MASLPPHQRAVVSHILEANNVTMEVCRYMHVEGTNLKFLVLIVYRAASDEAFEQIEIRHWGNNESNRKLDIGERGYLIDMSSQDEMVVTASEGRTVFELKLNANDALAKSEQLIALARIVGGKI